MDTQNTNTEEQTLNLKGVITQNIYNLYFKEKKTYSEIAQLLNKDIHYIRNIISRINNRLKHSSTAQPQPQPTQTQPIQINYTQQPTEQPTANANPLIKHIEQDLNAFIPLSCENYLNRKIEDLSDTEILTRIYNHNQTITNNETKYNLMIEGETATGKTLLIKHFCFKNKIPYIRVNCNENTTLQDLIGGFVDGGVFCYGYLALALKYGGFIVIDEINLANSGVISGINSVLDNDRCLIIQETGEKITAHKNFFIAVTLNPSTYESRKILGEDFKRRFNQKMFFDYDIRHEKPLIKNKDLIPFIEQLREMRTKGEINKPLPISLFMDFERDLKVLSEKTAINNLLFNFDEIEKNAIKNLYELVFKKAIGSI